MSAQDESVAPYPSYDWAGDEGWQQYRLNVVAPVGMDPAVAEEKIRRKYYNRYIAQVRHNFYTAFLEGNGVRAVVGVIERIVSHIVVFSSNVEQYHAERPICRTLPFFFLCSAAVSYLRHSIFFINVVPISSFLFLFLFLEHKFSPYFFV